MTVRIDGIEPTSTGWKPATLPLSYTRVRWSQGDLHPHRLSAKQMLSCLSYDPFWLVERPGIEPGSSACDTDVFPLDDHPRCPFRGGRPARNRTLSSGVGIRLVTMTSDL